MMTDNIVSREKPTRFMDREVVVTRLYGRSFWSSVLVSIGLFILTAFLDLFFQVSIFDTIGLFYTLLVITLPFSLLWALGNILFMKNGIKKYKKKLSLVLLPGFYTFIVSLFISLSIMFLIVMLSNPGLSVGNILSETIRGALLFIVLGALNWAVSTLVNNKYIIKITSSKSS